ncbi:MAG: DUF4097 family beta strand repeat protein [Clostridia bacterium]|nr:DUF4097 family beta strand repeat protein [Clostridia bacterium]
MKKLGKLAIIFAAVFLGCAIAGGIVTAIGLGQIANDEEFWNNVEQTMEEYGVMEIIEEVGDPTSMVHTETEVSVDLISSSDSETDSFEINIINAVGDIVVKEGRDGRCLVSYDGDIAFDFTDPAILMTINDDSLDIEFDYGVGISGLTGFRGGDIVITLPEGYTSKLTMHNCVGNIMMNGLMLDELSVTNFAGDINVENTILNVFSASDFTGDIDIEGQTGGFMISNCLGDISIESSSPLVSDSLFENCVGELSVDLPDGSGVNIIKDDYVGEVNIEGNNGSKKVDITLTDGVGEVDIEIGDR